MCSENETVTFILAYRHIIRECIPRVFFFLLFSGCTARVYGDGRYVSTSELITTLDLWIATSVEEVSALKVTGPCKVTVADSQWNLLERFSEGMFMCCINDPEGNCCEAADISTDSVYIEPPEREVLQSTFY